MKTPWIAIQDVTFPVSELHQVDPGDVSPNGRKALAFCKDWLDGKQSFVITTSGSTGTPKKIEINRSAMIASAQRTAHALGLKPGMTSLICLDTGFIAGMMMLVRGLTTGMNMIVAEPSANPLKDLSSSKIDFVALVPYQMTAMLQSEQREQLGLIATIILGGATVSAGLLDEIRKITAACYATFGMTETLSHIALQRLNGIQRQENFHVLDGIKISQDERDCLVIDADYLGEKIVTNDIVDVIKPGEFKWLGRWDNVINSGGIKVIPEKIEKVVGEWMLQKELQNRFFVAGKQHEQLGQRVVLVLEGSMTKGNEKELMNAMAATLDKYELPKEILYVDKFTETKTGKVDRSASLRSDAMDL
ncbi:MAG TPA: AMP-binding protein [Cyclobacteriaceae bacterium]|nr:AMP-binding protein [Cyclobacteriaceae bacterium]